MFKSFKVDNARRVEFEDKFIQITKSKWAYLRNNIDTFHTTGGEGTPSEPIPIVNVSEYNKAVTGQNLFSLENETWTQNNVDFTYEKATGILTMNTTDGKETSGRPLPIEIPAGTYTLKAEYISGSTSSNISVGVNSVNNTVNGGICCTLTSDNNYTAFFAVEMETAQKYLVIFLWSSSQILNNFKIRLWLVKGSYTTETMPAYQSFQGTNYPYRLEDVNGVLHEAGDLPDGTADTYNRETGELTKRTKSIVLDGTEDSLYWIEADQLNDYLRFRISNFTDAVTDSSGNNGTLLCSHFINGPATNTLDLFECVSIKNNTWQLFFKIAKSRLTGYSAELGDGAKAALLRTYLGEQYNAGTPVVVQYKLITPETYQLKQYDSTFPYNEKPIQVEDSVCNVFSDKNVKMKFKAVSY